ncbi:MAG: thiamine phosphate synthase [Crocinitomicaceae bacterium]
MNKYPKIYYISQGNDPETHLINIDKVCRSGCKLVQLRLKSSDHETILETAKKSLVICQKFSTKLIINDYLGVVEQLPQVGLHLGKNDISIKVAKQRLGGTQIGGTANTLKDCIQLINEGVDYIGLGPYKNTTTKSNLEPIVGLAGYQDILSKLQTLKMTTPIYAIGGIMEKDIPKLLRLGITGVAMSNLLTNKTENDTKNIISHYG